MAAAALGRDLEGRGLRLPADRDREVPRARRTTSACRSSSSPRSGSSTARCSPSGLPTSAASIAYSSLAQMGLITFGLFAGNDLGFDGAVLQMVNHGLISA